MALLRIIERHFWVIGILFVCLNFVIYKRRVKSRIDKEPDLAEGYRKLIRGYLSWMNVPWIVMGIGCTVGRVPTANHFFHPKDGNPFVIAWWVVLFILYILSIYWIFFCEGAEKLVKYQMIYYSMPGDSGRVSNPRTVKLMFLLCLACGIIAAIVMWTIDMPLPPSE